MSRIFFISDHHFGHKSILSFAGQYRDNGKLLTIDEHDAWLIRQHNSIVTKNDLVWFLGDVCFDKAKLPLLKKMNGSKHLILGNHDEFSSSEYLKYFNKIHGFMKYKGFWLSHAPIHETELRGKFNIHGHLHHNNINHPKYICVSVEQCNGLPISLEDILNKIKP